MHSPPESEAGGAAQSLSHERTAFSSTGGALFVQAQQAEEGRSPASSSTLMLTLTPTAEQSAETWEAEAYEIKGGAAARDDEMWSPEPIEDDGGGTLAHPSAAKPQALVEITASEKMLDEPEDPRVLIQSLREELNGLKDSLREQQVKLEQTEQKVAGGLDHARGFGAVSNRWIYQLAVRERGYSRVNGITCFFLLTFGYAVMLIGTVLPIRQVFVPKHLSTGEPLFPWDFLTRGTLSSVCQVQHSPEGLIFTVSLVLYCVCSLLSRYPLFVYQPWCTAPAREDLTSSAEGSFLRRFLRGGGRLQRECWCYDRRRWRELRVSLRDLQLRCVGLPGYHRQPPRCQMAL
ncbi:unnamed protein product [Amoebophrya sp. A120]|nr:unnamed protein product [Amoebophrya sp. A120]|eukprot:GSA120T00017357001.1